ncbi:MAG: T9SS type A sorting domain-containing protein [Crocinitomicaceae bacterium]|nr:T9SS type A sorting domain-containing protein [Crocinitomicaceae bacterium]
MKRIMSLILMAMLCHFYSIAQYCPIETQSGATIQEWNWTQEDFLAFIKNPITNETNDELIKSPFFGNTIYQPNTDHLAAPEEFSEKDFLPEDGWELIFYDMGKPNSGIRMPTFCLYNRKNGKLRIFYYLSNETNIDEVFIEIENLYSDPARYISAALEHANLPISAIENYTDKDNKITIPNFFIENADLWILAELPVAYDPCACVFRSGLIFKAQEFSSNTAYLNLEGGGNIEQIITNGKVNNNNSKSFNISKFLETDEKGSKAYKRLDKIFNDTEDNFAKKINSKLTPEIANIFQSLGLGNTISGDEVPFLLSYANSNPEGELSSFVNKLSKSSLTSSLPSWLTNIVPYIGGVAPFLDFFLSGSKSPPLNFSIDLEFTGSLIDYDLIDLQVNRILTPGSDQENINPAWKPIYNNILGIANLVESPEIYHATKSIYSDNNSVSTLNSYKLGKELKYAVNPASGLTVQDAKAALYFYNCGEGLDLGTEFPYESQGTAETAGLIEETDGVWRTPYMSLACLQDYSVFLNDGVYSIETYPGEFIEVQAGPYCDLNPTLHFIINFEETLYAAMYTVKMTDAPYSYEATPKNPFLDIPETVETDDINKVLNDEIQAWGEITITGGGMVTNDNVDALNSLFPKETTIIFEDSGRPDEAPSIELVETQLELEVGTILPDEFIVLNPPECGEVLPVDGAFLESFCNNTNLYNPVIAEVNVPEEYVEVAKQNIIKETVLKVSPNPANDFTNLNFTLDQSERVNIRLLSAIGQEMSRPLSNEPFPLGEHTLIINLKDLPSGTYLIEFVTDSYREIKKIIKD